MQLDDWPLPYVRVKCAKCDREGRLHTDRLIDRFGPDRDLYIVREKISQDGCQRTDKATPCMSILPDALLVQAILAEDDSQVLKPSLLKEAQEWRTKLGISTGS